jgi:putative hydrolase of the HAD superfamily
MKTKTIVFDLDDTLIHEIEYLKSAFLEISEIVDIDNKKLFDIMLEWYEKKENVFENIIKLYPKITVEKLKQSYRNHFPQLDSKFKNRELLLQLKKSGYKLGLISDGYSITQRSKIKAMNIESIFDLIVISEEFGSEKPNENNFITFHQFQTDEYFYVGDNTKKDFIAANNLGWTTICLLNNGKNIHPQNFNLDLVYLPKISIKSLDDLILHI